MIVCVSVVLFHVPLFFYMFLFNHGIFVGFLVSHLFTEQKPELGIKRVLLRYRRFAADW